MLHDGTVLLTGLKPNGFESGAEIYDPALEASQPVDSWPTNVGWVATLAVLVDGRVLLDLPAVYDPVASTFTRIPRWEFNDTPPAAVLPDGKVLLTGGNTDTGNVASAELFDPATNTFSPVESMSSERDGHTANLLPNGAVLIAGGATNSLLVISSAELYDPAVSRFSSTGSMISPRLAHTAVVLGNGQVLVAGGQESSPPEGTSRMFLGISSAELYTPAVLIAAPVLSSLSADGQGQGAIWHAATGEIASSTSPAGAGEVLSMYTTSLMNGGVIPPQVAVAGRLAEVLFFGAAPGYPGYYQVNFRVPNGVAPGPAIPVRLTYLGRPSNAVAIGVQ